MMRPPGPAPTSCKTCHQRKKKCDKARPSCSRCTEGGYKCLGYEPGGVSHSRRDFLRPGGSLSAPGQANVSRSFERGEESQTSLDSIWHDQCIHVAVVSSQATINDESQATTPRFTSGRTERLQIFPSSLVLPRRHPNPARPFNGPRICGTNMIQPYRENPTDGFLLYIDDLEASDEDEESLYPICDPQDHTAQAQRAYRYMNPNSQTNIGYSLPPKFFPDPYTSGVTVRFIMSQYEPFFELVYFRPIQQHISHIRGRFATRIVSSEITRCSLYIGAQMFRTLRQDREHADLERFVPLLDRLAQLSMVDRDDLSLDDLVGRLSGALEITFLKHLTKSAMTSYSLLRNAAPLFMQVAFADPTLWPRDPSSSGISLAHLLTSPFYDLGRFVFIGATTSMMFGTAPLVEYDTSHPITRSDGLYPSDWIHGCPPEFLFSILRITQWRVRCPSDCLYQDSPWKKIEDETWGWRATSDYGPDSESSRIVMRFAIQESWRHALLIYLYMGMCGVTSHDPRVQSSVRQISRLQSTISTQTTSRMHLMVPFLVAGACTRSEFDRRKFRAAVSQSGHKKMWLTKPMDIGCVLDHLWRGAGADGGPVTWDDYVSSRKATMNIGA